MEINTHGRKINLETLANASDSTKDLGSRTGEYMEIFTTNPPAMYGESITGIVKNGQSITMRTLPRSDSPPATRPSSRSRT